MQIPFNGTHFINAACILCLTRGPTRSWRNGDAQCCQLSNIATPLATFLHLKKAPKPLVSENRRYCHTRSCFPSTCTHLSLSLSLSLRLLSFCSAPAHTSLSLSLSASAQFLFSTRRHISLSRSLSLSFCICSVFVQRAAEKSRA